jgi:hypothetical protein
MHDSQPERRPVTLRTLRIAMMTRPQGHQSARRYAEQLLASAATYTWCVAYPAARFVTHNLLCHAEKAPGQGSVTVPADAPTTHRTPPRFRDACSRQVLLHQVSWSGDHFGDQGSLTLSSHDISRRRLRFPLWNAHAAAPDS